MKSIENIDRNTEKLFCKLIKMLMKENNDGCDFRIVISENDGVITSLNVEKYIHTINFDCFMEYPKVEYDKNVIDFNHLNILFNMCSFKSEYSENVLIVSTNSVHKIYKLSKDNGKRKVN